MKFRAFAPAGPVPPVPPGHTWQGLMKRALLVARAGLLAGEVPVGALIVDGHGAILATAANRTERDCDATAHAEILALRKAGRVLGTCRLAGCVLLSTLEPCPMCAGACVQARLAGVVYGAADLLAGAVASNNNYFDFPSNKIWHMGGILSEECAGLLNSFFCARRNNN